MPRLTDTAVCVHVARKAGTTTCSDPSDSAVGSCWVVIASPPRQCSLRTTETRPSDSRPFRPYSQTAVSYVVMMGNTAINVGALVN